MIKKRTAVYLGLSQHEPNRRCIAGQTEAAPAGRLQLKFK